MIKLLFKLPRTIAFGFSGGIDSVAAVDFLSRNHDVKLIYVNHGDAIAEPEMEFVEDFAYRRGMQLEIHSIENTDLKGKSREYHWSRERHRIFSKVNSLVVTAHHLNDAVETWLMSCIQGKPTLLLSRNERVVRPFLITKKSDFVDWAMRHNLRWFEDSTNSDASFSDRNFVRHELMPNVLKLNPGIETTIRKKLIENELSYVRDPQN